MRNSIIYRRAWLTTLWSSVALALVVSLACRDITSLEQENLGSASAATLFVPANALLLTNSAIADFECAYNRYVIGSGIFTDELSVAIAQAANFDYDARRFPTNGPYGTNNCGGTPSSTHSA